MSEIKPWRENIGKPEAYMIMCDVLDVLREKEAIKKAVYERLKQAPSTYEWIPCSERLPREEEQDDELGVLVTLGNGYSGLQCDWYHGDHWYDWDGFVVAWMPLPPVYQEEDNK